MKREVKIKLEVKQIYCQEMGLIYIAYDRQSVSYRCEHNYEFRVQ